MTSQDRSLYLFFYFLIVLIVILWTSHSSHTEQTQFLSHVTAFQTPTSILDDSCPDKIAPIPSALTRLARISFFVSLPSWSLQFVWLSLTECQNSQIELARAQWQTGRHSSFFVIIFFHPVILRGTSCQCAQGIGVWLQLIIFSLEALLSNLNFPQMEQVNSRNVVVIWES